MFRFLLALAAVSGVSFVLSGTDLPGLDLLRQGPSCTVEYTIRRGDTLSEIAERVYGRNARYHEIVAANRGRLDDPTNIPVGETILLPCPDPAGSRVAPQADSQRRTPTPATIAQNAAPAETVRGSRDIAPEVPVRLVTTASFAPFADRKLARGGLLADLVIRALAATDSKAQVRMAFVDNLSVPLIERAGSAFELSFPWFEPDCTASEDLNTELRRLCTDYAFSGPLHEVPLAFYALTTGPLAGLIDRSGLAGTAVCRPAGLPPLVPGRDNRSPAEVTMTTGPDTADCLERLMRGEVAAVVAVKPQADREVTRLGLGHAVAELTALTTTRTLHAIAPKANPNGVERLAALDRGLEVVKQSGEWFRVVSTYNARAVRP